MLEVGEIPLGMWNHWQIVLQPAWQHASSSPHFYGAFQDGIS